MIHVYPHNNHTWLRMMLTVMVPPIILYQARNTDPAVAVYLESLKVSTVQVFAKLLVSNDDYEYFPEYVIA